MAFDFGAAEKAALKDLDRKELGLLVLGQSGAGKSSVLGTFGCKTLYLYGSGEAHGPAAANTAGSGNIVPVCWDYDGDTKLAPGAAYDRLMSALSDLDGMRAAGFGAIVVDGATELEQLVRGTKRWEELCKTDKGKHNNFAEGESAKTMIRPVLDALRTAQRVLSCHFAVTCTLDIKALGDNGEVLESQPRLSGYGMAEGVLQQFRDIVVIGRMSKGDTISHRIQFLAGVTRVSKDTSGIVKKSINFNPRITGIPVEKLPATMAADLAALAKYKRENVK